MIGELPETIETWLIFHVVIWQRNGELSLRSFWFKIIRIVSLTGICIFFCPNFLFCSTKWKCIKQRILWHTPEFAEFKTGELWKSWSEVDKSWRKLSQQHNPSCSPDFGLQVNPIPSLLTQSSCNKVLRFSRGKFLKSLNKIDPKDHQEERFSRGKFLKRKISQEDSQ